MPLPDSSSIDDFGGILSDYLIGVVDPSTDMSAAAGNSMSATVAMGSRMVPRCEVSFTGAAVAPVTVAFEAVWKSKTPTIPTAARTGTGVFTFTFPASVSDELLAPHVLNLTSAWGFASGGTAYHAQASASANVLTVYVFTLAGAASDAVGATIRVQAR